MLQFGQGLGLPEVADVSETSSSEEDESFEQVESESSVESIVPLEQKKTVSLADIMEIKEALQESVQGSLVLYFATQFSLQKIKGGEEEVITEKEVIKLMKKKGRKPPEDMKLSRFFAQHKFFVNMASHMHPRQFQVILDGVSRGVNLKICEPGDVIIWEGERGDTFYMIIKGEVDVYVPETKQDEKRSVQKLIPVEQTVEMMHSEYLRLIYKERHTIKYIRQNNTDKSHPPRYLKQFAKEQKKLGKSKNTSLHDFIVDLVNFIRNVAKLEEFQKEKYIKEIKNTLPEKYVIQRMMCVAQLQDGHDFGADALKNDKPRNATVVARNETHLACLTKKLYDEFLYQAAKKADERKLEQLELFPIIKNIQLSFKKGLLRDVKDMENVHKGHVLYREGEFVDKIYFILKGDYSLTKKIFYSKLDPVKK